MGSQKVNILIVDDEQSFLEACSEGLALSDERFNIVTAKNGEEAIEVCNAEHLDLVVTDMEMPKMRGYELIDYLQSNLPEVPIIVMTAFGSPVMEEILKTLGVAHYFAKPIDINKFSEKISSILFPEANGKEVPLEVLEGGLTDTILKTAREKSGGQLILRNGNENGRIFIVQGKIAWIAASTQKQTLSTELITKAGLDKSDLHKLFDECKRLGKNFGETAIEWGLLDREDFRRILLNHITSALKIILTWKNAKLTFIDSKREYKSSLTFDPEELFSNLVRSFENQEK